jgi:hypothetical protein
MMDLYSQSLQSLRYYLDSSNVIHVIDSYRLKKESGVCNSKDKTYWYSISYPVILNRFEQTRGSTALEAWIERVGLISSWISSIPAPKLNGHAIEDLVYLENKFYKLKLEEVRVESYLGDIGTIHHGEMIFEADGERPPVLIKNFLQMADQIVNLEGRWDSTFPTTTKLLHFMCPHLFPIFDKNINNIIYDGGTLTYPKYHCYVFSLREYLQTTDNIDLLKKLAKEEQVSLIRLVDIILFNSR